MDGKMLIDNIRALCKKNNVTISKLESDLFLSPGLISRWNKNTPALDKIIDIAEYFNVTLDDLIGRTKNSMEYDNIGRFLILLYNRSLVAEINWEILNFSDPPQKIAGIMPSLLFSGDPCECYMAEYQAGFFFLTSTHTQFGDFMLELYVLPDIYSKPESICSDTIQLTQLYDYLSRRFLKQLNHIKSLNLINAFMQDDDEAKQRDHDKITPFNSINEASSF